MYDTKKYSEILKMTIAIAVRPPARRRVARRAFRAGKSVARNPSYPPGPWRMATDVVRVWRIAANSFNDSRTRCGVEPTADSCKTRFDSDRRRDSGANPNRLDTTTEQNEMLPPVRASC